MLMHANTRLLFCLALILGSAGYAVVVVKEPELASALASGYIAAILTWFVIANVWKKKL